MEGEFKDSFESMVEIVSDLKVNDCMDGNGYFKNAPLRHYFKMKNTKKKTSSPFHPLPQSRSLQSSSGDLSMKDNSQDQNYSEEEEQTDPMETTTRVEEVVEISGRTREKIVDEDGVSMENEIGEEVEDSEESEESEENKFIPDSGNRIYFSSSILLCLSSPEGKLA